MSSFSKSDFGTDGLLFKTEDYVVFADFSLILLFISMFTVPFNKIININSFHLSIPNLTK